MRESQKVVIVDGGSQKLSGGVVLFGVLRGFPLMSKFVSGLGKSTIGTLACLDTSWSIK